MFADHITVETTTEPFEEKKKTKKLKLKRKLEDGKPKKVKHFRKSNSIISNEVS